jgi:predicted ABC-type ATPase
MKELIIIAGANGSGKTTFSVDILERTGYNFLNADEIERELAVSKLEAGKEFFRRLGNLITAEQSFVLESTLSGNYLVKVIENAKKAEYSMKIVYVFLENPQDCIQRIKLRVELGGHFVPDDDVIRRYYRSKANFWNTYKNWADEWIVIYNSTEEEPQRVAIGTGENFVVELENLFHDFINNLGK